MDWNQTGPGSASLHLAHNALLIPEPQQLLATLYYGCTTSTTLLSGSLHARAPSRVKRRETSSQ